MFLKGKNIQEKYHSGSKIVGGYKKNTIAGSLPAQAGMQKHHIWLLHEIL